VSLEQVTHVCASVSWRREGGGNSRHQVVKAGEYFRQPAWSLHTIGCVPLSSERVILHMPMLFFCRGDVDVGHSVPCNLNVLFHLLLGLGLRKDSREPSCLLKPGKWLLSTPVPLCGSLTMTPTRRVTLSSFQGKADLVLAE
jgi:hypothetical protein